MNTPGIICDVEYTRAANAHVVAHEIHRVRARRVAPGVLLKEQTTKTRFGLPAFQLLFQNTVTQIDLGASHYFGPMLPGRRFSARAAG
jgi:hypothetical protein